MIQRQWSGVREVGGGGERGVWLQLVSVGVNRKLELKETPFLEKAPLNPLLYWQQQEATPRIQLGSETSLTPEVTDRRCNFYFNLHENTKLFLQTNSFGYFYTLETQSEEHSMQTPTQVSNPVLIRFLIDQNL